MPIQQTKKKAMDNEKYKKDMDPDNLMDRVVFMSLTVLATVVFIGLMAILIWATLRYS
jgi:cytoskeletal protein RodZ